MTTPVPDEAVIAGAGAIYDLLGKPGTLPIDRAQAANRIALAAVEAAVPLIRADERERIRQMAADLNAVVPQAIVNGVALSTVPFADLIAGEDSEARQWETGEDGSGA